MIERKTSPLSVPHHRTGFMAGGVSLVYQYSSEDRYGLNVNVPGRAVGSWKHHTASYKSGTFAFSPYTRPCPTLEMFSGCHLI